MFCSSCGSKHEDDARFCQSCGAPLPAGQMNPRADTQPPVAGIAALAPKRARRWWLVAAAIFVIILVGTTAYAVTHRSTPDSVADEGATPAEPASDAAPDEPAASSDAGPANARGNSTGNIANGGLAAEQGDWVYACGWEGESILKMHPDGSEMTELDSGAARFINVIGDWIYYVGDAEDDDSMPILRVRTDGTGREELHSGEEIANLNVIGDRIYWSGVGGLFAMNTDGTGVELLRSQYVHELVVVDDWAYYQATGPDFSSPFEFYKAGVDGSSPIQLPGEYIGDINVVDGWIYFREMFDGRYELCKTREDGSERTVLAEGERITNVNVTDEWVFFTDSSEPGTQTLVRMRLDGTEKSTLSTEHAEDINVVGDWIFYESGEYLMKMQTDGTGAQIVP